MNWPLLILSWSAITIFGFTLWAVIWYANKASEWKDKWEDERWLNDALLAARDRQIVDEAERITLAMAARATLQDDLNQVEQDIQDFKDGS